MKTCYLMSDLGKMFKEDKSFTHTEDYDIGRNRPTSTHEEAKVAGTTNDPLETGLVSRKPL